MGKSLAYEVSGCELELHYYPKAKKELYAPF